MSEDTYALLLALSLAAVVASALAAVVRYVRRSFPGSARAWRVTRRLLAFAALGLVGVAVRLHWHADHHPGSATPLGPWGFVAEHPATMVVGLLALVLLLLPRRPIRSDGPDPDLP